MSEDLDLKKSIDKLESRPDYEKLHAKLVNFIRETLSCPLCSGQLIEPYTMMCGHTFCWNCIVQWKKEKQTSDIQCPTCRACSQIPNAFIGNNLIEKILEKVADNDYEEDKKEYMINKRFNEVTSLYTETKRFRKITKYIFRIISNNMSVKYDWLKEQKEIPSEIELKYILSTTFWDRVIFLGEYIVDADPNVVKAFLEKTNEKFNTIQLTYVMQNVFNNNEVPNPGTPSQASELYGEINGYPIRHRDKILDFLDANNLEPIGIGFCLLIYSSAYWLFSHFLVHCFNQGN